MADDNDNERREHVPYNTDTSSTTGDSTTTNTNVDDRANDSESELTAYARNLLQMDPPVRIGRPDPQPNPDHITVGDLRNAIERLRLQYGVNTVVQNAATANTGQQTNVSETNTSVPSRPTRSQSSGPALTRQGRPLLRPSVLDQRSQEAIIGNESLDYIRSVNIDTASKEEILNLLNAIYEFPNPSQEVKILFEVITASAQGRLNRLNAEIAQNNHTSDNGYKVKFSREVQDYPDEQLFRPIQEYDSSPFRPWSAQSSNYDGTNAHQDPDTHDDPYYWTDHQTQDLFAQGGFHPNQFDNKLKHNPNIEQLQRVVKDYESQIKLRTHLLATSGQNPQMKQTLMNDLDYFKKQYSTFSQKLNDTKNIMIDRTKALECPESKPHSGYDLLKIKKIIDGSTDTERILRTILIEARARSLSHKEIKDALHMCLPDEAYKTFNANRQYPLSVILKLLSDRFFDYTSAFSQVNKINTFKFNKNETIRSAMVRLDTLVSQTNSLFPPNERTGRRSKIKMDAILAAVPADVANKLNLTRVQSLRKGIFYGFNQMIDDAEDILTSQGKQLTPDPRVLNNLEINATSFGQIPRKRQRTNGKNNNRNDRKKRDYKPDTTTLALPNKSNHGQNVQYGTGKGNYQSKRSDTSNKRYRNFNPEKTKQGRPGFFRNKNRSQQSKQPSNPVNPRYYSSPPQGQYQPQKSRGWSNKGYSNNYSGRYYNNKGRQGNNNKSYFNKRFNNLENNMKTMVTYINNQATGQHIVKTVPVNTGYRPNSWQNRRINQAEVQPDHSGHGQNGRPLEFQHYEEIQQVN